MDYVTVFNGADIHGKDWAPLLVPVILTTVGFFMVFVLRSSKAARSDRMPKGCQTIFRWFYFVFAAFMLTVFVATLGGEYIRIRNALANHSFRTTEGEVTEFVPMPATGHSEESFVVDGVKFAYSDYTITTGFHNAASLGGPIHGGEQVRIAYLCRPSEADCSDPLIIRLDIRQTMTPKAQAEPSVSGASSL